MNKYAAVALCALGATDFIFPNIAMAAQSTGIEVAVPAYVFPGDPFLTTMEDPVKMPVPPSIVIVNIANGDADESILDHDADLLRARVAASREHVKVIGYVHTTHGARSVADVEASIDRYLAPRNGAVHYDGIFFDEGIADCGPTAGSMQYRDYYRTLREYVWSKYPTSAQSLEVINIGTAVNDCYLDPAHRAADVFVTFEDTADHYMTNAVDVGWKYGWVGGNVIVNGTYALGTQYDSTSFWHLVYNTSQATWSSVLDTALQRYAGYVDATDAYMVGTSLNPWAQMPSYLNSEVTYANTLSHN
ncbi:spherulation-specific family 4 protein [Paraburkholderia megapolitana]|uniref:spherulation-specific family 4 protein n=1 Tax=Paraburkholderia megapolitana TaxID=420953 RepID=UPI0038BD171C